MDNLTSIDVIFYWFWVFITAVALVWYSTMTIYIAVRGATDIKTMVASLGRNKNPAQPSTPSTDDKK